MSCTIFDRARPAACIVADSFVGTRQGSFWPDDLALRANYPRLSGNLSCDLAVVGGGYLGRWSAVLAKQQNPAARAVADLGLDCGERNSLLKILDALGLGFDSWSQGLQPSSNRPSWSDEYTTAVAAAASAGEP